MAADSSEERQGTGLFRLARMHRIQTRYRDQGGRWRSAGAESVRAVLDAMGVRVEGEREIREAVRARRAELDARLLPQVTTVRLEHDVPPELRMRLPRSAVGEEIECTIRLDDGREHSWRAAPRHLGATEGGRVRAAVPLAQPLPPGYHEMEVLAAGERGRTLLIAAPPSTWHPQDEDDVRDWGVFMPLYALRSKTSWGTGDLSDLERMLDWTESLGGKSVGTLPLLAGGDGGDGGRVYAPVSRLFWNEVYLDVESAPELGRSEEARRLLESDRFRTRLDELRAVDEVDWAGAVAAKREVLQLLARTAFADGMPEGLQAFRENHAEVDTYARFRAAWEERGEPWGQWPESMRRPALGPETGSEDVYRYHLYVQWLADRRMRRLRDERGEERAGLYLDLPVGCGPDGFDVWRYQDSFASRAAVGAPPDEFFSRGQNWGFPPLHPDAMERSGFAYTIASLRHHMRVASRLRIDHVMSLHRLFWVPDGMEASEGVYVRYPHEALYAILCIESRRHRTAIVGEDLGTVPRAIRRALGRHGIERMYVAQFEAGAGRPVLPEPPTRSIVSVNTHDMPTFAAFWRGDDIDLRVELGFIDNEEAADAHGARSALKAAWVRFLQTQGDLDEEAGVDDTTAVLHGTHRNLARARASMLQVTLEDLWLEDRPQNVPGTGAERPNFRRKASRTLEQITAAEDIEDMLKDIARMRRTGERTPLRRDPPARARKRRERA